MQTIDGYELKEGDSCWVSCQDPEGVGNVSRKPRKAVYLDVNAKEQGWDFTIRNLRFNGSVEVIAVWREKPSANQHSNRR